MGIRSIFLLSRRVQPVLSSQPTAGVKCAESIKRGNIKMSGIINKMTNTKTELIITIDHVEALADI